MALFIAAKIIIFITGQLYTVTNIYKFLYRVFHTLSAGAIVCAQVSSFFAKGIAA